MSQKKYFNSNDARSLINIYGFAIFPIHGVNEDGSCTCNNVNCINIGKHPATPDGFKSASKDIEKVKQMWVVRKGLNVCIATGEKSGIYVVDCDTVRAYEDLKKQIKLPETLTVKTGRGYHLYFKWDDKRPVKNKTKIIHNVDIRGSGGYVAGVGSNHQSGAIYEYLNPLENIANAPQELYDFLDLTVRLPLPEKTEHVNTTSFVGTPRLYKTNDGWSVDDIAQHLNHIDPDCDYETWIKVGMALHEQGAPFSLFDDWSKRGHKYDGTTAQHWKSFNKGGGVSYGTIVKMAQDGGWKPASKNLTVRLPLPEKTEHVNNETGEITETKEKTTQGLYYIHANSVKPCFDVSDFVQGTLTEGSLSVVYGESNCGKTFFASDLAFHIVTGREWRGKRVEKGNVLYVSMEGAYGLNNRVYAYQKETGDKLDGLLIMPCTVDFIDPEGNINEFIAILEQAKQEIGDIKMIVIDTLARAIGGGDENSGQDMGMLVRHADAIRAYTGSHILFVHHSGKDKAKGARGHSSLRAAVDTEIEISREENQDFSNVKFSKQRDMEMESDIQFSLKRVVIGENRHGDEISSCIVVPIEGQKQQKTIRLNPVQQFLYDSLVRAIDDYGRLRNLKHGQQLCVTYEDLRVVMEERGFKEMMETEKKTTAQQIKSATQTARLFLQKHNKISFDGQNIWLMDNEN